MEYSKIKSAFRLSFAMDLISGVLLALGLPKYIKNVDILPTPLRIENYDEIFIVIGLALLVAAWPVMSWEKERSEEKNRRDKGRRMG